MFRPKMLIHWLVSLALILNGVGAAAASAVMATMPADAVASVASKGEGQVDSKQAAVQSGCHEHERLTSASTTTSPQPSHANADATDAGITAGEADSNDCCKDGACSCGCAHQSQIVLAAEFLMMPAIAPESIPRAHLAAPLSPSLSRPVRPPIA